MVPGPTEFEFHAVAFVFDGAGAGLFVGATSHGCPYVDLMTRVDMLKCSGSIPIWGIERHHQGLLSNRAGMYESF